MSLLCHGVAILNYAKLPSGEHPAKGRTVTGFANKAFNTTGAENMADSRYPGGAVFMPVCGDDAEARAQVIALATLLESRMPRRHASVLTTDRTC